MAAAHYCDALRLRLAARSASCSRGGMQNMQRRRPTSNVGVLSVARRREHAAEELQLRLQAHRRAVSVKAPRRVRSAELC